MSRRRPPRLAEQIIWDGTRAQRTGGAGFLYGAAPISAHSGAVSDALGALADTSARTSFIDLFTLSSGGAQDLALTYLPILDSWNVSISGNGLTNGVGYSISDQTLSLLAACDARSGEKVQIQYDYLTGSPTVPSEPFTGLIESLGPLWWGRLDDVSNGGTLLDASGHGHNGTWGAVTTHTLTSGLIVGDSDQALSMTGAGGEGGSVPSASWMNITQNLTWVVFFKSTDTAARLWAREQTSGGGEDWSLQFVSGQLVFAAAGSVIVTSTRTGLNDNNTHMATFRKSSTGVDILIDGVADNSAPYATALGTTAMDMLIGYGGGTTTSHMFAGVLDEAIWFDRLLTDTEVAAIWAAAT